MSPPWLASLCRHLDNLFNPGVQAYPGFLRGHRRPLVELGAQPETKIT